MARTLDIETLIEDALIANLSILVDSDVTVTQWDDLKDKDLTPIVKVKAQLTESNEGTINHYCALNILVDFGIFTSRTIDEDGRTGNGIRGDIRDLINQDNIVTLLNATDGLLVYNNGIIPQSSVDSTDGKLWQKTVTILVVATTVNVEEI